MTAPAVSEIVPVTVPRLVCPKSEQASSRTLVVSLIFTNVTSVDWLFSIYEDGLLLKAKSRLCLMLLVAFSALHAQNHALYIGNKACAGCHAEISRRYAATPMASSSGMDPRPLTPGAFVHAASGVRYEIDRNSEVKLSRG